MATTFTGAISAEKTDAQDESGNAVTATPDISPDAFIGVTFGGPLVKAYHREVLFYAITKQGGALFPLWWVFTHPTGWVEWSAFALFYVINVFSVDICLHRYFSHRAFETSLPMRYLLGFWAMFGGYGSVQTWVADHRRHHARTDQPGDPHSPHFDGHGRPFTSVAKGLRHAHLGWLYDDAITDLDVYGKGLREDPVVAFCHKTRLAWYFISVLIIPAAWGYAFGGTEAIFGTIMVAGFLRMMLALHALGMVNSIGHVYGSRRYDDGGHARNNPLVSLVLLGEGWHNNHHMHPRVAFNGRTPHELDPAGWVIWTMEKLGLVWNVKRLKTAG